ncbi:ADP-ribosyl-[dinitrogen reductase] hydrolase [Ideonella sp. A 288]|uniref:ADP-ribosyl-[dinitrogen reductase] hydrolase n=1 Tax=Ideonella sp. A 288 TaxID=1962181 RepID=UPI000B4A6D0F|nr:ADP-ribosyl-[dinitrogen reductase] hydrolase [Ideonella sp. A 288]
MSAAPAAGAPAALADLPALRDRALGAYLGLALGDALGATVEFMTPREIALRHGVHQQITGGGWLKLAPGQVTDDTTMSLALGEALLRGARDGRLHDTGLIAEAYVAWWRGKPVDCGNTCRRGIQRYLRDGSLAGPQSDGDGGNGALMRNLPAALATLGDDAAFVRVSLAQSHVTHHHPLSDAAVLGIGHALRALVVDGSVLRARAHLDALVRDLPVFRYAPYPRRASGYVVDTVQTVLHFYTSHDDFEDAVVGAVNQGDDADTTGALVGMLAGARCGAAALPSRWVSRLQPAVRRAITEQTEALLAMALRHRAPPPPA